MIWVELFTADRRFVATFTMSKLIKDYLDLLNVVRQDLIEARERFDDDDAATVVRSNQIDNAEMFAAITRFETGDNAAPVMEVINRWTLATVLGSVAPNPDAFVNHVLAGEIIQLALPATPTADAALQWRMPTWEERKDFITDLPDSVNGEYVAQCEECRAILQARIDQEKHHAH